MNCNRAMQSRGEFWPERHMKSALGEWFRRWTLVLLAAALPACGGGGGDEGNAPPPEDHPPNVGVGRIQIESPTQDAVTVDRDSVYLSGSAFINSHRCCSGTAQDAAVTVGWYDSAGGGGSANQSVRYCRLGFGLPWVCGHTWEASVPLTMGVHTIVVSAYDADGNIGYDSIRVTRVPDTTPPTVQSNYPAAGAALVAVNSTISVVFSESIDPGSVTPDAFNVVDRDGNRVPGDIAANNTILGARFLQFVATAPLATNMLFTATAGAGVRDESGNEFQAPHVWSFTTGPVFDVTPPGVAATTPANGTYCAFTDTMPTVVFDEGIDAATVNDQTFQLTDGASVVPGSVSALSTDTFRFSPHGGLRYATSYLATLTSGIRDLAGNSIAANHTWTFSTVAAGTGTWQPTAEGVVPARSGHTAVWTGREMIVWGGTNAGWPYLDDGYRYAPDHDQWSPVSSAGAPSARQGHVAVWTDSEMIVWGGEAAVMIDPGMPPQVDYVPLFDGARYNPVTNSWSPLSTVGAPGERAVAVVWTGVEMIVWTGRGGAKYNPATDSWLPLPVPIEPPSGNLVVWTGAKMIVWGGSLFSVGLAGAAYDAATNAWQPISTVGAPRGRAGQTAVWTGTEMIVWGGIENGAVDSGSVYNPQADAWRPMSSCGASPRAHHSAVWSGGEMIVWGGSNANTGQAYDPVTDSWRQLDVVNAPAARSRHTAVWTGSTMIVWGGGEFAALSTGGVYAP
jgi:N-acetylneuraminic acid mutarotase